jgi:hypothetical protein
MLQVARDPLVVYMQKDDPLARAAQVSLSDLAERLTVFRDPAVHPAAHNRLMEMLTQVESSRRFPVQPLHRAIFNGWFAPGMVSR